MVLLVIDNKNEKSDMAPFTQFYSAGRFHDDDDDDEKEEEEDVLTASLSLSPCPTIGSTTVIVVPPPSSQYHEYAGRGGGGWSPTREHRVVLAL